MTNISHILYMIGLVWISYKIFFTVWCYNKHSKEEKKRKKKHKRCVLINISFLFNVPRSMLFGKFGGRCKSLQCWMISWMCAAMERGVLLMLGWVVVICFKEISLQERKITPPSSFISGEVRGLCPPAFKWPLASLRSSQTRQQWTKALLKKNPSLAQWWKSENWSDFHISLTKVRESREADSPNLSPKAVRHLIVSPESWLKNGEVCFVLTDSMSLVLGLYCPFWPRQTSNDRRLHGLHRRWLLKVTMKLQLWKHLVALTGISAEHNAEKVQTNYVITPIFILF